MEEAFQEALDALRGAGVEVVDVDLPLASRWTAIASSVTMHAEAAAIHERWLRQRPADYGADVLARLLAGQALTAADYARAQAIREAIRHELLRTLGGRAQQEPSGRGADVRRRPRHPGPRARPCARAPTSPATPPGTPRPGPFHLQRLFSLTGVPAASAPAASTGPACPSAVQIAGRPWEEGLCWASPAP